MGRREDPAWKSYLGLYFGRERGDIDRQFRSRMQVTQCSINRLGLEKELSGHAGCVNCLEWNTDGSVLASASDDLHVILWDPFRHKMLRKIETGHTGNIFSVKFVNPDTLATCAADSTVRVRCVDREQASFECSCHCGRAKRLATAPLSPDMLWSAGEDGLVLQHDLRMPHRCSTENTNVLVNLLNHMGRYAEAKCVAINPRRPHQLALGANDFYVRMYDRRMIKLAKLEVGNASTGRSSLSLAYERQQLRCSRAGYGDPDNNIPKSAVQYFAPGHLSMEPNEHTFPKKATTYVTFNDDGNELLVNLGSEQIYIFDIDSGRRPALVESFIISSNHGNHSADKDAAAVAQSPPVCLPDSVREIKDKANTFMNRRMFSVAIEMYNTCIEQCPQCALLYSNRASALTRRGWAGDTYAAVRDCYRAIKLDPYHMKAHFRLAKALMDLKRPREAHECLLYFKDKFPRYTGSHAVYLLQKDINVALIKMETTPDEAAENDEHQSTSALERQLRVGALDYCERFLGHCNTTTDIKEANFLGPRAEFIAAGSDDGNVFIWNRKSSNIVRVLRGDESIVNCIQPHPATFLLATSGIESVVRLWSPQSEEGAEERRVIGDVRSCMAANQQRMRSDPFEAMLLNINFAAGDGDGATPACRAT